jgi:hypothetical protein
MFRGDAMKRLRLFGLIAGASIIGACVPLFSEEPLYSEADSAGGPEFRDGLWMAVIPDGDPCEFDPTSALPKWPECADALVIRDGAWLTPDTDDDGRVAGWDTTKFLLAPGDPLVFQGQMESDGIYFYAAVTPLQTTDEITQFRLVTTLCFVDISAAGPTGPSPEEFPAQALTKLPGAEACRLSSRAGVTQTLREIKDLQSFNPAALLQSEPEPGDRMSVPMTATWLRVPRPEDEAP